MCVRSCSCSPRTSSSGNVPAPTIVPERVNRSISNGRLLDATTPERSVGVWLAIVEAARGDQDVARWHRELEDGRRIEISASLEQLLGHPVEGRRLELLWAIFGPDFYAKLVREAGMSRADYEASLVDAVAAFARTTSPTH